MAVATVSPVFALTKRVEPLLNPYEEFIINQDYPGVMGYVIQLKTNLYIHRKHTLKTLFVPHSVYQATSMTALPNLDFLKEWLKNARQGAENFINKGEYTTEELMGGQYQSIKRHYNQWFYYDRKQQMIFGKAKFTNGKRVK